MESLYTKRLEDIASQLLDKKITSEKAEELARGAETLSCREPIKSTKEFNIIEEKEGSLRLLDNGGFQRAYVEFYFDREMDKKYLYLNRVESQESDQGYFGQLFKKLEELAKEESASYILLEVDYGNEKAISAFEYFGFDEVGSSNFISENIDRIFMRKDLKERFNLFYCK